MFDTLEQRFGRVLVLVNNAGVRADDLAISLTDADWGEVIDTNLQPRSARPGARCAA